MLWAGAAAAAAAAAAYGDAVDVAGYATGTTVMAVQQKTNK